MGVDESVTPLPSDAKNRAKEIVSFWTSQEPSKQFTADPDFDSYIQRRFGEDVELALKGNLHDWRLDPVGTLALVILLDQFCLNIFRGHGRRYVGEKPAREVSRFAFAHDHLAFHPKAYHSWYYLPFMHSENIADQEESVRLFSQPGFEGYLDFAKGHYDIILRFGRFPHRNQELGRVSTSEELEYLENGGFRA